MKNCTFALVDCNNFYASCEQVFRPELVGRPIVVLGNNDGCVVARSQEARALEIPLGAPYFQIRAAFEKCGGIAFSSNYALYGDMSQRVVETLRQLSDEVEVYSIDEAFLALNDRPDLLPNLASTMRKQVKQWTGLPVSIGLGTTKTLSKLANKRAKKEGGICDFVEPRGREELLREMPVEDVWGIGPRYQKILQAHNIRNALQLAEVDEQWARRKMTVMGQRTVLELRGIPCFAFQQVPFPKKAIARSRKFGRPLVDLIELREPLASYVASAARALRQQGAVAGAIRVHLETSQHVEHRYANSIYRLLPWPTAATGELIGWASGCLEQVSRPDYAYRRCGVLLTELSSQDIQQTNLFTEEYYDQKKRDAMEALDRISAQWGRTALRCASEGLAHASGTAVAALYHAVGRATCSGIDIDCYPGGSSSLAQSKNNLLQYCLCLSGYTYSTISVGRQARSRQILDNR
jgi:DNA polymerase V